MFRFGHRQFSRRTAAAAASECASSSQSSSPSSNAHATAAAAAVSSSASSTAYSALVAPASSVAPSSSSSCLLRKQQQCSVSSLISGPSSSSSSSSSLSSFSLLAAHQVSSRRFQGGVAAAVAAAPAAAVNPARITKSAVWNLWNEGNLFSMTVPELEAFLTTQASVEVAPGQKKAALVRKTEEYMAKENPIGIVNANVAAETVASVSQSQTTRHALTPAAHTAVSGGKGGTEYRTAVADLYDEADVYADWSSNVDEKKHDDFISFPSAEHASAKAEVDTKGHTYLDPKGYQLLHQECTADVGLARVNISNLPGCSQLGKDNNNLLLSVVQLQPDQANRVRFRRGFHWAVSSMWSAAIDAEVNIGAGKALYWRGAAKQRRPVLPMWTCQQHLHDTHPYTWYAVAHETSIADMEKLAIEKMGMTLTSDGEVSYKVYVKRSRDILDIDLNTQLHPTLVNRPWDRYLVSHYVRKQMPDLRFLVRGRHPIKRRISEQYLEAALLTAQGATVQSVLQPELGDVIYVGHRAIRRWTTKMKAGGSGDGVRLSLVETRRTPLVTTRPGDEGERIEYELVANIPQMSEQLDIPALAEELWDKGQELAVALENSMQELHAFTMSSAAAFVRAPRRTE